VAVVVGGGGADVGGVGGDGGASRNAGTGRMVWVLIQVFLCVENCSRVGDVVEETCCLCH
jgi:hypothetical protein